VYLLTQGLTDKEVAARLGLAEGTVGSYLKTVFRRLRVKSRAAVVSVILAAGLRRHSRRFRRIPTNVGIADARPSG
jgi:DNA-binding NarL/FixJ family response regulator